MKLETRQTEVRLVAENDIDKFFLDKFFTKKRINVFKSTQDLEDGVNVVTLTYEKE